jgi:hypothetical protein
MQATSTPRHMSSTSADPQDVVGFRHVVQASRQLHPVGIFLAYLAFYRMLLADFDGARTENPYEANLFLIPAQTCDCR